MIYRSLEDLGEGVDLPLLFVAGTMADASSWYFQREAFEYRPLIFPTAHLACISIREMAAAVVKNAPTRFDIVGWSMGGYVALELLLLAPERVRKAVLVSTSGRPEADEARVRRAAAVATVRELGLARACRAGFEHAIAAPQATDPDFLDRMATDAAKLGPSIFEVQNRAISERRDLRPHLPSIRTPNLVVAGTNDPIIPPDHSHQLALAIPDSSWVPLEDAGHCAPWERPRAFNTLLRDFLDGVASPLSDSRCDKALSRISK